MAGVRAAEKRYDEALAAFRRVTHESAGGQAAVGAYVGIGSVCEQMGRLEDARQAFIQALRIDPGHLRATEGLARLEAASGQGRQGIERLRESLRRRQDPEGYLTLGRLLRQVGDFDEAEKAYREAMRQRPDHAETRFELGALLAAKARHDEAETHLRRCIELSPDHIGARSEMGILLARQGRLDEAAKWLSEAAERAPQRAEHHYNLAIVEEERGHTDRAAALYRRVVELNPRDAQGHFHLGQLLAGWNRRDEAIDHLRKALAIKPDYAEARSLLDRLGVRDK